MSTLKMRPFQFLGQFTQGQVGRKEAHSWVLNTSVGPQNETVITPNILYSLKCRKDILPFLLCLLKLKPSFYSENQTIQKAETAAASMVVVATAKSTVLETILGAQEESVTQQDQMHVTHEKVKTSCWCEIHSCFIPFASHLHFHPGS